MGKVGGNDRKQDTNDHDDVTSLENGVVEGTSEEDCQAVLLRLRIRIRTSFLVSLCFVLAAALAALRVGTLLL